MQSADKRTARGFIALRKRFVCRADYLSYDADYRCTVAAARETWNSRYPQYSIVFGVERRLVPPAKLLAEVTRDREREHENLQRDEWSLQIFESYIALGHWDQLISRIIDRFWPVEDFPHHLPRDRHPARPFVTACIQTDPKILYGEAEEIFCPFSLMPEPMLANRGDWALDSIASPGVDVPWCIPVYPDLTAKDLEAAAPAIVARINEIFRGLTVSDRIQALRTENLSHQKIADRLGLTVKTVSATLKQVQNNS